MGNSRSRHRPSGPSSAASTVGSTQQQAGAQQQQPQYPLSQVYAPPGIYYPGQQQPAFVNNGQLYGGWRPPYHPQPQHPHVGSRPAPVAAPLQHGAAGGGAGAASAAAPTGPTQELTQTATIRNAVNLKKNTLEVAPLPGNPGKLAISFTFDASQPCCVTTFVAATEEPARACRLTTAKQEPAPPVYYDKGLGLKFPGSSPEGSQHVIDMSLYEEGQLLAAARDTFPLVVRLETVTDRGRAEGRTLQELSPGAEQQVWVQSQTTFAVLHREEDGSYAVRTVKQKIWVEGVSYELQEIYGLEQSVAAARGGAAALDDPDNEERLCVICLVNERDTTVLPCRHMCMCHECAQELRKQTSKCPICRNQVESLLHIKMYKGPKPAPQQAMTAQQVADARAANEAAEAAAEAKAAEAAGAEVATGGAAAGPSWAAAAADDAAKQAADDDAVPVAPRV